MKKTPRAVFSISSPTKDTSTNAPTKLLYKTACPLWPHRLDRTIRLKGHSLDKSRWFAISAWRPVFDAVWYHTKNLSDHLNGTTTNQPTFIFDFGIPRYTLLTLFTTHPRIQGPLDFKRSSWVFTFSSIPMHRHSSTPNRYVKVSPRCFLSCSPECNHGLHLQPWRLRHTRHRELSSVRRELCCRA